MEIMHGDTTIIGIDKINYQDLNLFDFLIKVNRSTRDWEDRLGMTDTIDGLDKVVEDMTAEVIQICRTSKKQKGKKSPKWWTLDLAIQRKRLRAKLRRFQKERDTTMRQHRLIEYRREKALYKKQILQQKRNTLREYLQNITTQECFGKPYQFARNKDPYSGCIAQIKNVDGTFTETKIETIKAIIEYHFDTRNPELLPKTENCNMDQPFTATELRHAVIKLKGNKAPGLDGLPPEVIKALHEAAPNIMLKQMNKCLELSHFPTIWKRARIILIPKSGKDLSKPDGYRPISLLPVWGKVLDKLLTTRLVYFLESNKLLNNAQHGFRKGRSTTTAMKKSPRDCEQCESTWGIYVRGLLGYQGGL